MPEQNLLSIGFNVSELSAEAQQVLKIVEDLYKQLKQYDNLKLSPVNVVGLTQLTAAIQAQQTQLNSLNTTLTNYTAAVNANAAATVAATSATKTNTVAGNNSANMQAQMGKNALKTNDALAQQKILVKELSVMYINANKSKNWAMAEQFKEQLKGASKELEVMKTNLDKAGAGGGLRSMGKQLGEAFGLIRNIAYILPGIGMAGIFNLAGEALEKLLQSMMGFSTELEKQLELEKRLQENMTTTNQIMADRLALGKSITSDLTTQYENELKIIQASGLNYEQQIAAIDKLNKKRKEDADGAVESLQIQTREVDQLQLKQSSFLAKREQDLAHIKNLEQEISIVKGVKKEYGIIKPGALEFPELSPTAQAGFDVKGGALTAYESMLTDAVEAAKKVLESDTKNHEVHAVRLNQIQTGLNEQTAANQNISEEAAKRGLYFSEESRKIIQSNAEKSARITKENNQAILNDQLSTEKQRLDAIKNLAAAEVAIEQSKRDAIVNKVGATGSQIVEAENNFAEATISIRNKASKDGQKVILDYWMKNTEFVHQAQQTEIIMEQLTDKTLMDNEQETYNKRMQGLVEYIEDRERVVYNQLQKDLAVAEKTMSSDLYEQYAITRMIEYNKQVLDIHNGVRKDAYDISESWFRKELELIKNSSEVGQTVAENNATKELTDLNNQFKNREISYKEFASRRAKIEHDTNQEIKDAKVKDNENELAELTTFRETQRTKLIEARKSLDTAQTQGDKERFQGEIDAATEQVDKLGKQVTDKEKELAGNRLKAVEDFGKAREDLIKQRGENWKKVEEIAIKGIQDIVDAAFEKRMQQIQELNDAQNKAADNEIAAIERSTIAQDSKNAYEIQLNAQKEAREESTAKQLKKIAHDQAVFQKSIDIGQIILNTTLAITGALAQAKILGIAAAHLAISYGAIGAAQLAIALATDIPSYAEGGIHKEEGLALFGEAGHELVKEPHKKPYLADRPTIKHLPAGTELLPLYPIPSFSDSRNDSWAQTLYLGKQIAKSKREIKNVFKPKITVDLGKQSYIQRILHG
jgi:hypothetical protein